MKKHIYRISALFILGFTLYACQVDDEQNDTPEVADASTQSSLLLQKMGELISKPTSNGSLLLSSHKFVSEVPTDQQISISNKEDLRGKQQSVGNKALSIIDNSGRVVTGSKTSRNTQQDLSALFGTTVKIASNEQITNKSVSNTQDVYLPDLLSQINIDRDALEVGSVITWNVDELNDNGLLFHLTYDPKVQVNYRTAYDNQYRVAESFAVTDASGSYTIQNSDLERFPNNAVLKLTLIRGAIVAGEGQDPSFIAVTEASVSSISRQ